MASLAGLTLAFPGTAMDRIWILNSRAYQQLAPLGKEVGIPVPLLAAQRSPSLQRAGSCAGYGDGDWRSQ